MNVWFRVVYLLALISWTGAASELSLIETIALKGATYHVQGIEIEGSKLWVTSVDVKTRRGLLLEFALPGGELKRSVELQKGEMYHPGGLSGRGDFLWVPVAEYRRASKAVVQKRRKDTLALVEEFTVEDHIGAVAVGDRFLVGANWDARQLYVWTNSGELVNKVDNPTNNAFQDLKFVDGQLGGGGLVGDKSSGAIDWLSFPELQPLKRTAVGKSDRNVSYTHEGIAFADGKIFLLPEDDPSRLFTFKLVK